MRENICIIYMEKYVLFIPITGLNDMLIELKRTIDYCRIFNRTLLFSMKQSPYNIDIRRYFKLDVDIPIVYDAEQIKDKLRNKTLYPKMDLDLIQLMECNSIYSFGIHSKRNEYGTFTYRGTDIRTPNVEVEEEIVLKIGCLGTVRQDIFGYEVLNQFIWTDFIKQRIRDKMSLIKNYLCIQVRCTDHKCDYIGLYEKNKVLIHSYAQIYIATDQKDVVQFFRSKELPVFCFTTFPEGAYHNLHQSSMDKDIHFFDTLCDIFIASNSDQILSNSRGGFIELLRDCHKNKETMLNQLK